MSKDLFGIALLDYANGNYTEDLITSTNISDEDELPLPYLFRPYSKMPKLEQKALKLAHMEEWVSGLKLGIHSKVGERGVQLSGGQRQRIGIARALYYEADILVFDEATSALDGITEKAIMNAIHDFTGKKTMIMIAHRLSTVQKCDQIFIIDKGSIVDSGTYQQLLEKNEQFKKM